MVSGRPSSTPTVVISTVPSLLSSVAFNTAPQLKVSVVMALILGTDVSTAKDELVTGVAAFPAASDTLRSWYNSGHWLNLVTHLPE